MNKCPRCPHAPKDICGHSRAPRRLPDSNGQLLPTDASGRPLRHFGVPHAWFDHVLTPAVSSDVDLWVTQNGLSLVIEFKHTSEVESLDASRQPNARGYALGGQRYAQSQLAQTGLFVVYMVEYGETGDATKPPNITRCVRLTDGAGAWQWKPCNYETLRAMVWNWRCNALNYDFVRRQKEAAAYGQLLQIRHANWNRPNCKPTQEQFEALRLTQRKWRNPSSHLAGSDYEKFEEIYTGFLLNTDGERSSS